MNMDHQVRDLVKTSNFAISRSVLRMREQALENKSLGLNPGSSVY
jgi:hypothetical protein